MPSRCDTYLRGAAHNLLLVSLCLSLRSKGLVRPLGIIVLKVRGLVLALIDPVLRPRGRCRGRLLLSTIRGNELLKLLRG